MKTGIRCQSQVYLLLLKVTFACCPSSDQFGDYYRLLTKGKYIVTASADGFIPAIACVDVHYTPSINGPFLEAQQVNFLLLPTNFKRYDVLNSITIPPVSKPFHISGYLHDKLCLKQYSEMMNVSFTMMIAFRILFLVLDDNN
ncbi:hypothetical protein Smp_182620 [Schistosoma mansoni]|uniref:hypothetical protein n=1 Tax=Schistosoma mansoni TaxID=6183 RepID=UPI00022DCB9E|nr:hypothetical protein Smp_182620 [Schistosoma mansoni]|eukprot:XP_018654241.1 hypothetical protein Smp_182620 [Schistosoma mansoni]